MTETSNATIQSESTDPWRVPRPIYIDEQMEKLADARFVTRSTVAIEAIELGLAKLIEAHRASQEN